MSQNTLNPVSEQLNTELRHLHKVMQAISILGEQPAMQVMAYGKIWLYADLLKTAVRYAQLAELHGYDVKLFKQWFIRDVAVFHAHGIELKVS